VPRPLYCSSPFPRRRVVASLALAALVLCACQGAGGDGQATRATQTTGAAKATATTADTAATSSTRRPGGREPTGEPVTLAFGGDVHFEGAIGSRLAADPATTLGPIAGVLRRADLAMVNLETAITERGTPAAKDFTFRAPPSALTALKDAGVDVATMANNHGLDFGQVGLRDSLAAARAARFPVVGIGRDAAEAYRPWQTTVKGQRIAVIAATQVLDSSLAAAWTAGDGKPGMASAYQEARLLAAVRAARASADTVVVDLHWGRELVNCPIDRQRDLAPKLVAAGADVVVGSHAHILLGGGYLRGAYVHYGLGNFVFYARGGPTAQSGVLLLTLRGRAVTASRWVPARIANGIPIPLQGPPATQAITSWQSLRPCTGLSAKP
jgi:poly-gamma-glutamate capsule biosynthesis protein CapA/YwtB (metallophosphatase superfamily)